MGEYRITGGKPVCGEYRLCGAKNAALPILAASAMGGAGMTVLHNCPDIADVAATLEVLRAAGCKAAIKDGTAAVDAAGFTGDMLNGPAKNMRGSIVFLGVALGAVGRARIARPGGCNLGERPIDLHLSALRKMGAEIEEDGGVLSAAAEKLTGADIRLALPSVGATEQIMIAACLAEGDTIIRGAAREPEIRDLQTFLNGMGAEVYGAGSPTIVIRGVKKLRGATHSVMPDRIVGGTFLCAAAITGGEVKLLKAAPDDLRPVTKALGGGGAKIFESGDAVAIKAGPKLKAIGTVITEPHPGFPTDMAPQLAAALALARGTSIMKETIFEARGGHVGELKKMGADISLENDGRTVVIKGVKRLKGAEVAARDLRGGAAMILAGLAAEGETVVKNSEHVARGYENFETALKSMGADIALV
jgi:UDP-N-acetylglucosamine 1-carboxyvinyltransferase